MNSYAAIPGTLGSRLSAGFFFAVVSRLRRWVLDSGKWVGSWKPGTAVKAEVCPVLCKHSVSKLDKQPVPLHQRLWTCERALAG